MIHAEKVRLVNPHKRKRRASSGARRRSKSRNKNPNALVALGLLNPHKEKRMKRTKKRSGTKRSTSHRKARRKNPFVGARKHHARRRKNPSTMSLSGTSSILKGGFFALIGLVVARQIPQMLLGARNTGLIGYGSNLLATFVAAMVGTKFLGPDAGKYIAVGGGVYMVNRALTDNLSPVGKVLSLSGIGDHNALGDIQSGYFPLPVPTNGSGQPIIPVELRPAPAMMPAKSGVGSVAASTRFNSRF